jgi:hypothetical protein
MVMLATATPVPRGGREREIAPKLAILSLTLGGPPFCSGAKARATAVILLIPYLGTALAPRRDKVTSDVGAGWRRAGCGRRSL